MGESGRSVRRTRIVMILSLVCGVIGVLLMYFIP